MFKRLYSSSFLFLLLLNGAFGQKAKLMLPIGHTYFVYSAQFSPHGDRIVTASRDRTAKIWEVASGKLIADLKGHISWIYAAQYSPDGKKIVTASEDKTAKVWDAVSGKLIADLKGHTLAVKFAQFSPASHNDPIGGKKIVTVSEDHTAKVWDASSGKLIANLKGHKDNVRSAEFSPDGKMIVTASWDNTAKIWDAVSGNLLTDLNKHTEAVNSAQFSPDGKKIVTASNDNTSKIWDATSGKLISDLKGHSGDVNSAQFSPDGKMIVTASNDSTVKIWDAASGNLIANLKGHTGQVHSAQFSPSGKKIASASGDHTAKIWDAASGKLIADLKAYSNRFLYFFSVQFSPDGKKIVTAFYDEIAKIWDATSGILIADLKGHTEWANSAEFSPDGKRIVTASMDHTAKIWDIVTGKPLVNLKESTGVVNHAEFSRDGKKIITTSVDSTAKIWDAVSGKLIAQLKGHTEWVYSAEFSPDGKKIITASDDSTVKIWDAVTGNVIGDLKKHTYRRDLPQFSPDGKEIMSTWDDYTIKIWDAYSLNLLIELKGHTGQVNSAQFSPDGKMIVTASNDSTVKIWDAASGNLIANLKGHTNSVISAQYSSDGKKIITVAEDPQGNKTAKTWDATSGKLIADLNLKKHTDWIRTVQFSPDGKNIMTASYDNTIKIWDATSGILIADLKGHSAAVLSAKFSPDGKQIVSTSEDNTVKIWNVGNGTILYTFITVDSSDYLVVDSLYHYDGTEGARKLLYFTCGTEIIELDQVKDQLWVPNLAERILKGDSINAKSLDELNVCGLTSKVEDVSSNVDEYYFKITPRRGGLGETVVYLNGIEAKRYKPEQLQKNSGVYELRLKKDELSYIAGMENPVIVKAYTSDNAISSRGLKIKEDRTKQATISPNLYAVLVGVSDYKGDDIDLSYAAIDATDVSITVADAAKKLLNTNDDKGHVIMYNLTTAKEHYQFPEKKSIKKVFEEIGTKATANDILFVFLSGHGVVESEKKQFYFMTADAASLADESAFPNVGISMSELTEWIKPQNIKAQKRILIMDACNSGQAINNFVTMGNNKQDYPAAKGDEKSQQIKAIDKLNEKSGLFILSASASTKSAFESSSYSHGFLTYSLLKVIKQQPDILEDGKFLNISRWFNAAGKMVSDIATEQGVDQRTQIVANTDFNIGLVDEEVISKIVLPMEKPLFTASNFQNEDENIAADNLGLNRMTDHQLSDISSKGMDAAIVFASTTISQDAYTLSGRYTISGNNISMKVLIRQNNEVKQRIDVTGTKDKLDEFAVMIASKAADWASKNK